MLTSNQQKVLLLCAEGRPYGCASDLNRPREQAGRRRTLVSLSLRGMIVSCARPTLTTDGESYVRMLHDLGAAA